MIFLNKNTMQYDLSVLKQKSHIFLQWRIYINIYIILMTWEM